VYSTERAARARIVAEHDSLLDALRQGDTGTLIAVMDAHRDTSQLDVISVLSRPHTPR
jgi:DNA-binding GntR family transcriptional regulator